MKAKNFIREILVEDLQASYVAVGENFRFGHERKGTINTLRQYGDRYGYHTEIISKEMDERRRISSTYVREELSKGNMEKFHFLMGTDYTVEGIVKHGRGIGNKFLLPTTNLLLPEEKLTPPKGVYVTVSNFKDRVYQGITNIGYKPTIGGETSMSVETYLLDCEENLYGKFCKVDFKTFLRPEEKFASLEALKEQIEQDVQKAREYFL